MSDFADRMKRYEMQETQRRLIPLLPVYVRIDGRTFSNFTRRMKRPYDERMIEAMVETTKYLVKETNACIGYTQSDEINLVINSDSYNSSIFFDAKIFKLTSVLAGITSSAFLLNYIKFFDVRYLDPLYNKPPAFDCRVINMPSKTEAANMILWREYDATRNAIVSAASTIMSHKQMHKKNTSLLQELLFANGINFNDYPSSFKRGTYVKRIDVEEELSQEIWDNIPDFKKPDSRKVKRHRFVTMEYPQFSKILNREEVIFDDAEPITED